MKEPTIIEHEAVILDWHDGDTCKVRIKRNLPFLNVPNTDLGFRDYIENGQMYSNMHIRLWGLNTPELRVEKSVNEKGIDSKEYVSSLCPVGTKIRIITLKNPEKFGRWLGIIFFVNSGGLEVCLNELILKNGYAIPYLQGNLKFW